jgi:uncharacterized protein YcsI (UPF0317 family)
MDKSGKGLVNAEKILPGDFRKRVRGGEWEGVTTEACSGYAQANLVVVPKSLAFDFFLFCQRNPQPCPIMEVTDPGQNQPRICAKEADLRTDLPKYRVFENGKIIDEPGDIQLYWQSDSVAFLLGCSTNFDYQLHRANVQYRYIGDHTTSIECEPAGRFHGTIVVSTRLFKTSHDAVRAVQITSRNRMAHGPPVHIGNPKEIGITDIYSPDMFSFDGSIDPIASTETIMSWACGVTPQICAVKSKIPFMITHYPGYMFVTDLLAEELSEL